MSERIFIEGVVDTRDGRLHFSAEAAEAAGVPLEAQAAIAGHVDAIRVLVTALKLQPTVDQ